MLGPLHGWKKKPWKSVKMQIFTIREDAFQNLLSALPVTYGLKPETCGTSISHSLELDLKFQIQYFFKLQNFSIFLL